MPAEAEYVGILRNLRLFCITQFHALHMCSAEWGTCIVGTAPCPISPLFPAAMMSLQVKVGSAAGAMTHGVCPQDVIEVSPEKLPGYDQKIKSFFEVRRARTPVPHVCAVLAAV